MSCGPDKTIFATTSLLIVNAEALKLACLPVACVVTVSALINILMHGASNRPSHIAVPWQDAYLHADGGDLDDEDIGFDRSPTDKKGKRKRDAAAQLRKNPNAPKRFKVRVKRRRNPRCRWYPD